MSYRTQARMAQDKDLMLRVTACAAREGIANPQRWAFSRNWEFSARSGWDASYASAIAAAVAEPTKEIGNDPTVITDAMILSAVQAVRAAEAA